jgi:hypothetical protein
MQPNLSLFALALAVVALAVAGYAGFAATQERSAPGDSDLRLDDLEARLARIEETPALQGPHEPILRGRERSDAVASAPRAAEPLAAAPRERPEDPARIEELVQATVEKKASQLQVMRNKKPSIALFTETLEMTGGQRYAVEREVVHGQRELHALLSTPTSDGSLLLDDLVEALAHQRVDPEQAKRAWGRFLGRVLSEQVPGMGETYGLRAEAIKGAVREGLRRTLSEAQYETFLAWRLDPTEIQEIEASPWSGLEPQVLQRAEALRAENGSRD